MKILFRIFTFGRPLSRSIIPFVFFSFLSTIFGVFNFALLIPLLSILFDSKVSTIPPVIPELSFTIDYIKTVFYHYFLTIANENGKFNALIFVCCIIVASVLLTNIFLYLSIRIMEYLRAKTVENIRNTLFAKITNLHLGFFSDQRKGDLMARLSSDSLEVEGTIAHTLQMLIKEPFKLIGFFVALFYLSFELTIFSLFFIPLAGGSVAYIVSKLKNQTNKSQQAMGSILSTLDEAIGGLRIIKGFNAGQYIQDKFRTQNSNYADILRKMARTREMASPVSEFLGVFVLTGILLYGGSLVLANGTLRGEEFVTYIILFSQVMQPAKVMASSFSGAQRGISAAERIFEVLDTPNQIQEVSNAVKIEKFEKEIEFKDVYFTYGSKKWADSIYENLWVLKDINFTIKKGQMIALVGETGSGKSTIADLIPRFYDVQEGEVLIDGINLKDADLGSIRDHIGIVTQEAVLFNDTIWNNIAFATPNVTMEQIQQAAKIAHAHDFIMKTENGYDTIIGDRGMKLAGGQRQRITIARAILKNPPILILDEATSALDTESEKLVQDALENLMENRTSLVIAHRLSTIQKADKILVLKNGEIVESGTHEDLLKYENGYYRKLNNMQALQLT